MAVVTMTTTVATVEIKALTLSKSVAKQLDMVREYAVVAAAKPVGRICGYLVTDRTDTKEYMIMVGPDDVGFLTDEYTYNGVFRVGSAWDSAFSKLPKIVLV